MHSSSRVVLWGLPAIPLLLFGVAWFLTSPPKLRPVERKPRAAEVDSQPAAPEIAALPPLPSRAGTHDGSVAFRDGYGASAGLRGFLWFAADEGGSNIVGRCGDDDCLHGSAPDICATGRIAQVADDDWTTTWGAAVGWNIAQAAGASSIPELGKSEVTGLSFKFRDQSATRGPVRFGVRLDETEYCAHVEEGENRVKWSDLKRNCWDPNEGALVPEPTTISALKWHVVATDLHARDFDVCISDIQELRE